MPVIPLVNDPDSEELRELYDRLAQTMPDIGVLNIFKVMAHNPQLLRGWLRMATPLLAGGLTLSPRLREISILRVAQVCGSEYEFAHHIRIAQQAGLTEDEIASLQNYDESEHFSDLDRAVVRYTDAAANLSPNAPELARDLKRWLSDRELLELSFCVGHWGMLARVQYRSRFRWTTRWRRRCRRAGGSGCEKQLLSDLASKKNAACA